MSSTSFDICPNTTVGGDSSPLIICGPCAIESRESTLRHAEKIVEVARSNSLPIVFKSSYDKANRTKHDSFRGVGIEEGLSILQEVKNTFSVPVITDVHSVEEVAAVGEVADILQVPAFLCRQTDILVAAGNSNKTVMIKKGQFLAPEDMKYALEKVSSSGNQKVMLCERGSCFGYRDLVVDFRGICQMKETGAPVIYDATHSVQVMGGAGGSSSGNRKFLLPLLRAACAVGIDGVFLECHENPESAPSDGANMLPLDSLEAVLKDIKILSGLALETRNG